MLSVHSLSLNARRLACAASIAVVCGASIAQPASPQQRFEAAVLAYERNHWPQAYRLLAELADDGHGEAARMALQMWQHGPALYRTDFVATARQVERWTRVWGCSGDVTSAGCLRAALEAP